MQVQYENVGKAVHNRFTGEMHESIDTAYYICQTYNRLEKNTCINHKIETRDLYHLALKDILELAALSLKNADSFNHCLSSQMDSKYMANTSQMLKEREHLEKRTMRLTIFFFNLYTDKAKRILMEQRFIKLTTSIGQEQESNRQRLQELTQMMRQSDEQKSDVKAFFRKSGSMPQ